MFPVPIIRIILAAFCFFLPCLAVAAPFGSWINVKAECGAVGDGKTDDTAAIQRGLDMTYAKESTRRVLFFPAGQYRITSGLKVLRNQGGGASLGIGLQGQGGGRSQIVYDGQGGEPILTWGAGYSTIRSLGFQSADSEAVRLRLGLRGENSGKPTAGISMGPVFSTASEIADCTFQDLPIGILGGQDKMQGQAEVCVRRCAFVRCGYGLLLQNWNSLDWWVWDCEFRQCQVGVSNKPGCGNYNVYRSFFSGSEEADCLIGNLGGFGFVENVSEGSGLFLSSDCHTAGANLTLQGNRVSRKGWDNKRPDSAQVYIGQPGPVLLLDNLFRRAAGAPGPEIYLGPGNRVNPSGSALLIGNRSTVAKNSLVKKGTFDVRQLEAGGGQENLEEGQMPAEAKGTTGIPAEISFPSGVLAVRAGAEGGEIQKVLDKAPDGSVVHLPSGKYMLDQPLVVPGGKKLTIRGDGFIFSTCLQASRDFQGEALVICQPTDGLILQDLQIAGSVAGGAPAGLLIRVADRPGVAVHGDQAYNLGFGPGLVVEGLDEARVVLENHQHNGVAVLGGPQAMAGKGGGAAVEILQGASSRDKNLKPETPIYDVRQGGKVLVRDIWYEGHPPEFMQVRDRGDIVFVGGHVAPVHGREGPSPDAIRLEGQAGSILLAQAALNGADLTIGQLAEGFTVTLFGLTPYPGTSIRYTGGLGGRIKMKEDGKKSTSRFVQLMCRQNNLKVTGSEALPDVNAEGDPSGRFQILRDWKLPDPDEPARVRLHRVRAEGGVGMVVVSSKLKEK